jgi:uncharacterized protein (TIRG00374 family)
LNKKLLSLLKVLVFLSLGLFLVWFAVRGVTQEQRIQIREAFGNANYSWVILSLAISIISHLSRAMRWKMMLQTLGHEPKLSNTFFAVMIGYMANYAPIPRLGEASRCGILTRYEKIPFTESFGTVVAERLIDVLCLMIVFFITFLVQFAKINALAHQYVLDPIAKKFVFIGSHPVLASIAILLAVAGLIVFLRIRKKQKEGVIGKAFQFLSGFLDGLKTVKNIRKPWLFIGHTIVIWGVYYITLHLCFFALPETSKLGLSEGITVFALGTLGVVFTPGGIGAYQVIVKNVLILFAVSESISIAFPWIVWTSSFLLLMFLGLVSLILLPILNKEINASAEKNPA